MAIITLTLQGKDSRKLSIWIMRWLLISSLLVSTIHSQSNYVDRCPFMEAGLWTNTKYKRKTALGPNDFIKNVMPRAPKLERFVDLEVMLEDIGENSSLYEVPDKDKSDIITTLYQDPNVQKIIKDCEKFHIQPSCDQSVYRTMDGTCNNLKNPEWGSTFTEQIRIIPPVYEGAYGFRKSISGRDLPAPRNISLNMKNENHPSKSASALFTFFGQFTAHDLTLTPVFTKNGEIYDCCEDSEKDNPKCAPIYFPKDDPFYSRLNLSCQNFIRAIPYPKCNFDKRSPLDSINSFLDMSTIYGNNDAQVVAVRSSDNSGKLISRASEHGEMLWMNNVDDEVFCPYNHTGICFTSGDPRVNQHTILTVLHTVFVRLHNIIADIFHQINTNWNGEKIFQETRRIVAAINQRIVYGEYLPRLVGPFLMNKYDLNLNFENGSLYDEEVNPTLMTEFSGAAFRLHSMIPKDVSKNYPQFKFQSSYSACEPLYQGHSDCLLAGTSELPSQKNDHYFMDDVSRNLYRPLGATYGFDIISMNIQRGRDLGLPSYTELLKNLLHSQISEFDDLKETMSKDNIDFIRKIYSFPADIDLYAALLLENFPRGSEIGSTAAEIIAKQFFGLKFGDSFFFTHTNGRNPFTPDQLKSIEATSLAQIMCMTTKMEQVRLYPLLLPKKKKNPLISCSSLPQINLDAWKN